MRKQLAVALAALLTGCADLSVPMATPSEDAAGKQMAPPSGGDGVVYLFSNSSAGVSPVVVDGRHVGTLGPSTWMRLDLVAGSHSLNCAFKEDHPGYVSSSAAAADPMATWGPMTSRPIDVRAGDVSFFEVGYRVQWVGGFLCTLTPVNADFGRQGVLAGRRIRELR